MEVNGGSVTTSAQQLPLGYEVIRATDYNVIRDQKYLKNWPGYIDDLLVSGQVADAAIYDLSGACLATSRQQFSLSLPEFSHIIYSYVDTDQLRAHGVTVNDVTYKLSYADGRGGIMGRLGLPARGCSLCKTNQLLIVAVHSADMNSKKCNEHVMNIGDFFIGKNL